MGLLDIGVGMCDVDSVGDERVHCVCFSCFFLMKRKKKVVHAVIEYFLIFIFKHLIIMVLYVSQITLLFIHSFS